MYIITCCNNRYVFAGRDPIGDVLWTDPCYPNHFSMFSEREQAAKALASFPESQQGDTEIVSIITPLEV